MFLILEYSSHNLSVDPYNFSSILSGQSSMWSCEKFVILLQIPRTSTLLIETNNFFLPHVFILDSWRKSRASTQGILLGLVPELLELRIYTPSIFRLSGIFCLCCRFSNLRLSQSVSTCAHQMSPRVSTWITLVHQRYSIVPVNNSKSLHRNKPSCCICRVVIHSWIFFSHYLHVFIVLPPWTQFDW